MPIVRAGPQLIYYAHVPKCGGSAVETYLAERFGAVAFVDARHHFVPPERRWSRTSPQHVHLEVLDRLFPKGFFDHSFTVVRHPVARIVSAYHFQLEIEQAPSANIGFSYWLEMLTETMAEDPFVYDNHTRPMVDLVPEGAEVFHLEHGLDALVPWFDRLTGAKAGPRAVRKVNERKRRGGGTKVQPGKADLDLIGRIYAADFERFGYEIGSKAPRTPAPELSAEFLAERDSALARTTGPAAWLRDRLNRVAR